MDAKNKKPRWRLNAVDIVIIAVVLAAAAALLYLWRASGKSSTAAANLKTVTYAIELSQMEHGAAGRIKEGDVIYDSAKKYVMGTVISVSVEPAVTPVKNLETGDTVLSRIPDQETAIVRLECRASENDAQITAESGYVIRVGEKVQAAGPGYAGLGYIIAIDREEVAQ
jgi:hypothetical protein